MASAWRDHAGGRRATACSYFFCCRRAGSGERVVRLCRTMGRVTKIFRVGRERVKNQPKTHTEPFSYCMSTQPNPPHGECIVACISLAVLIAAIPCVPRCVRILAANHPPYCWIYIFIWCGPLNRSKFCLSSIIAAGSTTHPTTLRASLVCVRFGRENQ
uniref:Uncharacterized protein n=1 Tax=Arundo donax TaxID=35708 RepID=A0A0A9DCU0_ARUDO